MENCPPVVLGSLIVFYTCVSFSLWKHKLPHVLASHSKNLFPLQCLTTLAILFPHSSDQCSEKKNESNVLVLTQHQILHIKHWWTKCRIFLEEFLKPELLLIFINQMYSKIQLSYQITGWSFTYIFTHLADLDGCLFQIHSRFRNTFRLGLLLKCTEMNIHINIFL